MSLGYRRDSPNVEWSFPPVLGKLRAGGESGERLEATFAGVVVT